MKEKRIFTKENTVPLAALLVASVFPLIYKAVLPLLGFSEPEGPMQAMAQFWPGEALMVVIFLLMTKHWFSYSSTGFGKPQFKKFYWLIPEVLLVLYLLSALVSTEITAEPEGFYLTIISLFLLAVGVGVLEELLSRGIVLSSLAQNHKILAAGLGSGLIFAFLHISNYDGTNGGATFLQVVETFGAGVYAAMMALALRSIIPLMVTHFLYDFLLFLMGYFGEISHAGGGEQTADLTAFSSYLPALIYLIFGLIIYLAERKNMALYVNQIRKERCSVSPNTAPLLIPAALLILVLIKVISFGLFGL